MCVCYSEIALLLADKKAMSSAFSVVTKHKHMDDNEGDNEVKSKRYEQMK